MFLFCHKTPNNLIFMAKNFISKLLRMENFQFNVFFQSWLKPWTLTLIQTNNNGWPMQSFTIKMFMHCVLWFWSLKKYFVIYQNFFSFSLMQTINFFKRTYVLKCHISLYKGAFKNYVDQFLPNFDHLPTYCWHLSYYLPYVNVDIWSTKPP